MMTALPSAATTSAAVWRPIPLLPPTTTSFCPAKTDMAIWWSMPSSQFMVIPRFLMSLREPAVWQTPGVVAAGR